MVSLQSGRVVANLPSRPPLVTDSLGQIFFHEKQLPQVGIFFSINLISTDWKHKYFYSHPGGKESNGLRPQTALSVEERGTE